jgi:hypothetical protein
LAQDVTNSAEITRASGASLDSLMDVVFLFRCDPTEERTRVKVVP